MNDILFTEITGKQGNLGLITLTRPKVLNALSQSMLTAIHAQLKTWAQAKNIKAVLIKGESERAFCAGGDIRYFYDHGRENFQRTIKYFWDEYRTDHAVHHFPKPYISFLHGITMGGGVGISIPGSHRIAAENLIFAMPETGIGFYPDVGIMYYLARAKNYSGYYAGLTGEKLSVNDAYYMELIDAIVPAKQFDTLTHILAETAFEQDANATVTRIIQQFAKRPEQSNLEKHQTIIKDCFSKQSVEEIIAALNYENSTWSKQIVDVLLSRSPTSLKVTLEALQRCAKLDFDKGMQLNYQLTQHFLLGQDFYEGIRAAIIDKDRMPKWQPATVKEVSNETVRSYFTLGPAGELIF